MDAFHLSDLDHEHLDELDGLPAPTQPAPAPGHRPAGSTSELAEVLTRTEGRSLRANVALVRANARLGARIARAIAAARAG